MNLSFIPSYLKLNPVFIPLIFQGFYGVVIIESIGIVYQVGRRVLGEPALFKQLLPGEEEDLFLIDRCRFRVWKVIFKVEKTIGKIDTIYSRVFKIRTEEEITQQSIREVDLYFMEIFRIAFKTEVKKTINKPITSYTVLLINFSVDLIDKTNALTHKIQIEKLKEKREIKKKFEAENDSLTWC